MTENNAKDPLRSVHTSNFPEILSNLGISLVVSTYQAGKLIILRADEGIINTHFRMFKKPMGMAVDRAKIAIGTAYQVVELRNVPAVAQKLDPPGKHDACYIPRHSHITGDIDIHEMSWGNEGLWLINTRFSCLCTLDKDHSFVPRWRPPFVSVLTPEDRCHLNGLGMVGGKPKYVTALGATNSQGGWRENKANGGILMDVDTNEFILTQLSMPHSPRWYQDRLWVLESGNGGLGIVNLKTGKLQTITQLPGFTRGIDFYGPLAFIGLSQVRETAVFSGIPITERLQERICGVWCVNIQTGQTVAFLRFEEGVQEIFAVQVLSGIRFPEVIDFDEKLMASSYVLPDEALADVPLERKQIVKDYQVNPELINEYNHGVSLREEGNDTAAIAQLKKVINLESNFAPAYNQLGIIYNQQNLINEALTHFQQAVNLQPELAEAHFNLGMCLLKIGDFTRGFAEYEWRWKTPQFHPINCPQPLWDGQELRNKTLLVHTEQGAGDAIQFIRYLPLAAQKCDRIVLFCPEDLVNLFSNIPGVDKILTPGTISLSEFQAYAPLMSLPRILGTTLATIPASMPYLNPPDNHHLKLASDQPCKLGIVWSGNVTNTCQLKDFLPILKIPGISFYSLQKGEPAQEITKFSKKVSIQDLNKQINNYSDTAAAIAQLDLIITVDTTIAHLAGALNKPVWVILNVAPDWRWMLEREDSPWYPTMKLFRQQKPQDWAAVFKQIAQQLKKLVVGL